MLDLPELFWVLLMYFVQGLVFVFLVTKFIQEMTLQIMTTF